MWITPFGYPGITGYVLLPPAFRSLSRPSSPDSSKASAINLYSLDHIIFSASKPFHLSAVWVFFIQAFFPFHSAFRVFFLLPYLIQVRLPSFLYNFKKRRKNHFVIFTYRVLICSQKARIFYFVKTIKTRQAFNRPEKETIYSYLCVHKHFHSFS